MEYLKQSLKSRFMFKRKKFKVTWLIVWRVNFCNFLEMLFKSYFTKKDNGQSDLLDKYLNDQYTQARKPLSDI